MPFGIEKHYFVGIVFIILCACLWAGSSVLIQYIYSDLSFNSPFLLTYLATSLLVLHLPYHHGKEWLKKHYFASPSSKAASSSQSMNVHQDYSLHDDDDSKALIRPITTIEIRNKGPEADSQSNSSTDKSRFSVSDAQLADHHPQQHTSDYDTLKLALVIAPMWFLANCLYNYSLLMTTVSSSTVIR